MDTDSSDVGHSEIGGEGSSVDGATKGAPLPNVPHDVYTNPRKRKYKGQESPRKRVAGETQDERWERLKDCYNDQYLNLLNESNRDNIDGPDTGLGSSQIGTVLWSGREKEKFFDALSRKSKSDIRGVANMVGSKSELEVYDYLILLKEEDMSTHLYANKVESVNQDEIPAAIEIHHECEAMLETAADALAVYQDRFDRAVGEQKYGDPWLIDYEKAEAHDSLVDEMQGNQSSDENSAENITIPAGLLFRLSSWLSLTERVFMNSDPFRSENNWTLHAAQDELPAITHAAVSDLYEAALNETRKLVQASISLAESRIRSTEYQSFAPKALVKEHDVVAATEVLGLQQDRSNDWVRLARRLQLNVVDDQRKHGRGRNTVVPYHEVESILSETGVRGRRGRSLSSGCDSSRTIETDESKGREMAPEIEENDNSMSHPSLAPRFVEQNLKPSQPSRHPSGDSKTNASDSTDTDENQDARSGSSEDDNILLPEDAKDRHLEILDQIDSRHHEFHLYHDLGWPLPDDTDLRDLEKLAAREEFRHKAHCKPKTDLRNWRDSIHSYAESWEKHALIFTEEHLAGSQSCNRANEAEQGTKSIWKLPFRAPGPANQPS
jgi:RNA polymerase I-specific transcription initiation factor RRN5